MQEPEVKNAANCTPWIFFKIDQLNELERLYSINATLSEKQRLFNADFVGFALDHILKRKSSLEAYFIFQKALSYYTSSTVISIKIFFNKRKFPSSCILL